MASKALQNWHVFLAWAWIKPQQCLFAPRCEEESLCASVLLFKDEWNQSVFQNVQASFWILVTRWWETKKTDVLQTFTSTRVWRTALIMEIQPWAVKLNFFKSFITNWGLLPVFPSGVSASYLLAVDSVCGVAAELSAASCFQSTLSEHLSRGLCRDLLCQHNALSV